MKKYRICPHCDKPVEIQPVIIKGIDGEVFINILMVLGTIFAYLGIITLGL